MSFLNYLKKAQENLDIKQAEITEVIVENGRGCGVVTKLGAHYECDGVIIATPHYDHPIIAMKAFEAGLHVLCEKPLSIRR